MHDAPLHVGQVGDVGLGVVVVPVFGQLRDQGAELVGHRLPQVDVDLGVARLLRRLVEQYQELVGHRLALVPLVLLEFGIGEIGGPVSHAVRSFIVA